MLTNRLSKVGEARCVRRQKHEHVAIQAITTSPFRENRLSGHPRWAVGGLSGVRVLRPEDDQTSLGLIRHLSRASGRRMHVRKVTALRSSGRREQSLSDLLLARQNKESYDANALAKETTEAVAEIVKASSVADAVQTLTKSDPERGPAPKEDS